MKKTATEDFCNKLNAPTFTPLIVLHSVPVWLSQTQTWIYNQIRYLPECIESHILCEITSHLDQFEHPNLHVFMEAPQWRTIWDRALRKLKLRHHTGFGVAIARKYPFSILHSHFGDVGWANLEIARQSHLKHVVTFYGFDVNYLPTQDARWHQRYHALFQQVDRVLCEGEHMAKCIVQLGCPIEKVQVHHLGIAIDDIPFQLRSWRSNEPLRVLIAASFSEKKGIPYALEALGRLQHDIPLEITIIGDARNTPESQQEKQAILDTIAKHNLQTRTSLLGYQSHSVFLEAAYNHHLFLSPSVTARSGDTEGGAPVSLIEVAASGMPIVSTFHCDIPAVVQHGVTGWLAPERDVEGLVQHLRWWVQHPDQWRDILVAGRQHVTKEYDAQTQGQRLAALYNSLMSEPG